MYNIIRKLALRKLFLLFSTLALIFFSSSGISAPDKHPNLKLGSIHNEIAKSLIPNTKYQNIVNIGCGWASGVNFVSGLKWIPMLEALNNDPGNVYNILTDATYFTPYGNRYAVLLKAALEQRDNSEIRLFDLAKSGHTSPYGKAEIDELDIVIAEEGGQLIGNTLVLYEYGPPDFLRLMSMLFDRDPALNPIATINGGEPFPPGVSVYGDSYWQASAAVALGADPVILEAVLERYRGHFLPTASGATPYVDETAVLGGPSSNTLTVSDRFFASYKRDYNRLLGNAGGKYGSKVDIVVVGNENVFEGGNSFRQYARVVNSNPNAIFPCTLFPTLFGCNPATVFDPEMGIIDDFIHPFAEDLEKYAKDYTDRMKEQAQEQGVTFINVFDLFAGHHSRFDDPTSPYYVADDPTYWAYMAEINALGQEVVADVMMHILNTGNKKYHRKHSDVFMENALDNEFPGVFYEK